MEIKKLNDRITELEACISIMSDNITDMWDHMSEKLDEGEDENDDYILELLEQNPAEHLGIRTNPKPNVKAISEETRKMLVEAHSGITRNVGKPKLTLV